MEETKRNTAYSGYSDFDKRKSTGASFVGTEDYVSPEIL